MMSVEKKYKFLPPEGGWGYLVTCGMVTPMICGFGSVPSFGLIFSDFLNSNDAKADTVAVIISFFLLSFNFSGLITNILCKRFSKRSIALSGSLLYIIGSILTIFVTTKLELFITYGLLQGAGFGLMTPISFAVFNSYFVKRRSFMMSASSVIMVLGMTLYPILVDYAKKLFGFRGCLALIAAVSLHTFIAMIVMHPFEWHSKRVRAYITKDELLINSNTTILQETKEDCKMETEMVLMPLNTDAQRDIDNLQCFEDKKSRGLWSKIIEFLDLNLMKDPIYVNIALGISFATYSDTVFVSILPSYLLELKYSDDDIATVIASGLGADLLSRVAYSFASAFIDPKSREMFLFGVIFMLVGRIAFMYVSDFMDMMIVNGIIGFFRAWIYITPNLIFAEHLPLSRFASGFGLYMFLQGITIVIFGVFISWIHNTIENYGITFYVAHGIMIFCIVPWVIEILSVRLR